MMMQYLIDYVARETSSQFEGRITMDTVQCDAGVVTNTASIAVDECHGDILGLPVLYEECYEDNRNEKNAKDNVEWSIIVEK